MGGAKTETRSSATGWDLLLGLCNKHGRERSIDHYKYEARFSTPSAMVADDKADIMANFALGAREGVKTWEPGPANATTGRAIFPGSSQQKGKAQRPGRGDQLQNGPSFSDSELHTDGNEELVITSTRPISLHCQ
ncbi:hypothetical protein JVT61DRAFT_5939 [Boletus reticuloceps]|uniref:Uncharacterized protein n=1 Tax=Boletus reticuloceps TaxID=495285 RepID=A0A8I2YJU1_9AGAM|nr:hypothetical protein JVT61DRAFT_5939 [Boletus reticuloceps]